jgi:hypothetical protein
VAPTQLRERGSFGLLARCYGGIIGWSAEEHAMRALIVGIALALIGVNATATTMKPTAPAKMMNERDQQKMKDCEARAAAQNVPMNERSKFVMQCMTKKDR